MNNVYVLTAIFRSSLFYFALRAMTILEPQTKLSSIWRQKAITYELTRCFHGESRIANRWRNPADGVLVVVMQRLYVDDFTAFLLLLRKDTVHLNIPAVTPADMTFHLNDDEVTPGAGAALGGRPRRAAERAGRRAFPDAVRAGSGQDRRLPD